MITLLFLLLLGIIFVTVIIGYYTAWIIIKCLPVFLFIAAMLIIVAVLC